MYCESWVTEEWINFAISDYDLIDFCEYDFSDYLTILSTLYLNRSDLNCIWILTWSDLNSVWVSTLTIIFKNRCKFWFFLQLLSSTKIQTKTELRKTNNRVGEQFPRIGPYGGNFRGDNFILTEKDIFLSLPEMKCFRSIMKERI